MNAKEILETIYDMLAQNAVDPLAADELLRRVDHINYDDMTIVFDQDSNNSVILGISRL